MHHPGLVFRGVNGIGVSDEIESFDAQRRKLMTPSKPRPPASGLTALGGPARYLRHAPDGESSQNILQLVQRLGQG